MIRTPWESLSVSLTAESAQLKSVGSRIILSLSLSVALYLCVQYHPRRRRVTIAFWVRWHAFRVVAVCTWVCTNKATKQNKATNKSAQCECIDKKYMCINECALFLWYFVWFVVSDWMTKKHIENRDGSVEMLRRPLSVSFKYYENYNDPSNKLKFKMVGVTLSFSLSIYRKLIYRLPHYLISFCPYDATD